MTLDHSGKELIVPIGIEDGEAYLYFFDCDTIRPLLYPLNDNDPHVFSSLLTGNYYNAIEKYTY
jgi:hypothetical protein